MYSKEEKFIIENCIERVSKGLDTKFVNEKLYNILVNIFKKRNIKYQVFSCYEGCSKYCFYVTKCNVDIIEIICKDNLRHQSVLGSIMNLNIDIDCIGDIMVGDKVYFAIKNTITNDILNNLKYIGNSIVKLKIVDFNDIEYIPKYQDIEVVVPSLRSDVVISRCLGIGRKEIDNLLINKDIMINYNILNSKSYLFKDKDIFSIRRYGKYIYDGIKHVTKKNHYVIKVRKYL